MCGGKIAGPISRHAVLALLVGALLATLPPAIVRRLRRRNHSQWQQHGQHRHQRAALQRRQQQQQHQRQQPEPVIAAQRAGARRLLPGGQVGAGHRRQQTQAAQVGLIQRNRPSAATPGAGQRSQSGANAVRTYRQYRHPPALRAGGGRSTHRRGIGIGGQQQDMPVRQPVALQQRGGTGNGQIGALAVLGHHRRRQRIQVQRDIGAVFGQWNHLVGIAGVYQQRRLSLYPGCQQFGQFAAQAQQPARRDIVLVQRAGKLYRQHQAIAAAAHRLRADTPARPGQRATAQQPGQWQTPAASPPLPRRDQLRGQQMCIDNRAQMLEPVAAPVVPPAQRQQQQQQPQRLRTQQYRHQGLQAHCRPRSSTARASRASAAASQGG